MKDKAKKIYLKLLKDRGKGELPNVKYIQDRIYAYLHPKTPPRPDHDYVSNWIER